MVYDASYRNEELFTVPFKGFCKKTRASLIRIKMQGKYVRKLAEFTTPDNVEKKNRPWYRDWKSFRILLIINY